PDPARRIIIDPLGKKAIQPASLDVRLGGPYLREFDTPPGGIIRPSDPTTKRSRKVKFGPNSPVYFLRPGEAVLGATHERIAIPDDIVAKLEGKSSLARDGLAVHITAGIVDPGWDGHLTFEFVNLVRDPIQMDFKMYCAQLLFALLTSPAERPYGHPELSSKYQGDAGPQPSRYHLNSGSNS
ncbi:MAG: dCTP deaminase, partial [Dehalococcoidia bacterium]|nr:dCTP deaminase [Dehalococcoidia bacterium]